MPITKLRLALAAMVGALILSPSDANAQVRRTPARTYRAPTVNRNVNVNRSAAVNRNVRQNYNGFRPGYGTAVAGGRYVPGYGVMGGYPGGYSVAGGTYAPGFGVMGYPTTAVSGGTYMPGFGVTGGAVGSQRVQGGTYVPGYGVR